MKYETMRHSEACGSGRHWVIWSMVMAGHMRTYSGAGYSGMKGSVCFVLKFALPPFSPHLPFGQASDRTYIYLVIWGDFVHFLHFWLFVRAPVRRPDWQPGHLSTKSQKCKHCPVLPTVDMYQFVVYLHFEYSRAAFRLVFSSMQVKELLLANILRRFISLKISTKPSTLKRHLKVTCFIRGLPME